MAPHSSNTPKPEMSGVSQSNTSATRRRHQRIPRACDRCRMKKAKCDGRHQCNQCAAHDSPCTYTHRKHHPATNYYLQMLNLSNEAIRRMYMACKDNDCFPGELPVDDHDRNVSVHAILGGLGLLTDGMLPFNAPASPSENSGSRRQSQSHVSSQPPRTNSGSCNPSMDGVDASTLNSTSALPSGNYGHSGHSARSSTSHHSFHNFSVSPNTQTHSFDSSHQSHDMGPPFLHNVDYLSFGSQNSHIPMVTLAGTNMNGTQLLRNDFFFPWPATFVAAMDTTGYHQ